MRVTLPIAVCIAIVLATCPAAAQSTPVAVEAAVRASETGWPVSPDVILRVERHAHRARHPRQRADQDGRPAGRRGLCRGPAGHRLHPAGAAARARRSPRRPKRGCCSTTTTSTSPAGAGTRTPSASSPTTCAATARTCAATTTSASVLDTFHDRRNGYPVLRLRRSAAFNDVAITDERTLNIGLEHRLGREGRAVRGRLDRRDGDPVQVAALRAGPRADLGHQHPPDRALEERACRISRRCRPRGARTAIARLSRGRDAGRPRGAAGRR